MANFLNSFLNILSSFGVNISNGFQYLPITQIAKGSIFSNMTNAVNFVNAAGQYFLGQSFGSNSALAQPSFKQAPTYQPGNTTPPPAFPTAQQNGYVVPLGTNPVSMYHLSSEGLRVLKAFEGLQQRPYVINGQKFIGYGHQLSSSDTTTYISIDQANSFLAQDVLTAEGTVKGAISVKVAQGQFDALVDFAYTMPASQFQSSNVVSAVNSGDIAGACTALAQWAYINLNGILQRSAHLTSRRTQNVHWLSMGVSPQPPT